MCSVAALRCLNNNVYKLRDHYEKTVKWSGFRSLMKHEVRNYCGLKKKKKMEGNFNSFAKNEFKKVLRLI